MKDFYLEKIVEEFENIIGRDVGVVRKKIEIMKEERKMEIGFIIWNVMKIEGGGKRIGEREEEKGLGRGIKKEEEIELFIEKKNIERRELKKENDIVEKMKMDNRIGIVERKENSEKSEEEIRCDGDGLGGKEDLDGLLGGVLKLRKGVEIEDGIKMRRWNKCNKKNKKWGEKSKNENIKYKK